MHPLLRKEVIEMYSEIYQALPGRAICRFSYALRTFKEQDELYAIGRTKPGKKVTNAKSVQSYHNYGLAFDIVLLVDNKGNSKFDNASWETNVDFDKDGRADWFEVVTICKRYGWEWGGDWKFTDLPHFQKTSGYSLKDLKNLVKSKKLALANSNYSEIINKES